MKIEFNPDGLEAILGVLTALAFGGAFLVAALTLPRRSCEQWGEGSPALLDPALGWSVWGIFAGLIALAWVVKAVVRVKR